jgi:hypothetical protein
MREKNNLASVSFDTSQQNPPFPAFLVTCMLQKQKIPLPLHRQKDLRITTCVTKRHHRNRRKKVADE